MLDGTESVVCLQIYVSGADVRLSDHLTATIHKFLQRTVDLLLAANSMISRGRMSKPSYLNRRKG